MASLLLMNVALLVETTVYKYRLEITPSPTLTQQLESQAKRIPNQSLLTPRKSALAQLGVWWTESCNFPMGNRKQGCI